MEASLNYSTNTRVDEGMDIRGVPTKRLDPSNDWSAIATTRLNSLTKPIGSLGRLEELAAKLVCIQ